MTDKTYTFDHDGATFTIPKFKKVKSGLIRKSRKLEPVDAMYTILEGTVADDVLEALDDMDMDELEEFMTEWQKDSGVSLGESED